MSPPLVGMKVIEFGNAMAGPYCALMLADYGAEVIKIERMGVGDDSRSWSPQFYGAVASYFVSVNRNKQSIAIDLKSPEGAALIQRIVADADVIIDNYRLGALDRAGLGYDSLREVNPRLIYCSISGFGASGPLKESPANDLFMQAYSGGMSVTGYPDGDPVKMGISVCDVGAGMLATIGILMALHVRDQTGRGQRVDTSLLEGQISMLSYHITRFFASGVAPTGGGSGGLESPVYRAYQASDGWLIISCFNQTMWRNLCVALGQEQLLEDPRFLTAVLRTKHKQLVIDLLTPVFAASPIQYWLAKLDDAGVPCSPINTIDKVVEEEQVKARELIVEMELDGLGPARMAGLPLKFSETPGAVVSHPPRLGQHTRSILAGLDLRDEEIDDLIARGVIGADEGWTTKGSGPAATN